MKTESQHHNKGVKGSANEI